MEEKEKEILSVIVMDNITGGWLLFPRSKQYFSLREELQSAINTTVKSVRQTLMVEEYTRLQNDISKVSNAY